MRIELPDNAREAFQFVALAVGIVAALRLGYHGIDHLLRPVADDTFGQALAPYRAGFLVNDRTLVAHAPPLIERLGLAVLISLALAVLGSLAGALTARPLGRDTTRWAVRTARTVLLIALPLSVVCALAIPQRMVRFGDRGLDLVERPWSAATLGARSHHWPWERIGHFEAIENPQAGEGPGLMMVTTDGTRIPIWSNDQASTTDLQHLTAALELERQAHATAP